MTVSDPLEELETVVQLDRIDGRRVVAEIPDDLVELVVHRAPVRDGGGHVRQDRLDVGDDAFEELLVSLPIHLQVHHGLGQGAVGRGARG